MLSHDYDGLIILEYLLFGMIYIDTRKAYGLKRAAPECCLLLFGAKPV